MRLARDTVSCALENPICPARLVPEKSRVAPARARFPYFMRLQNQLPIQSVDAPCLCLYDERKRACVCYPSIRRPPSPSHTLSLLSTRHRTRTCGCWCVMPKTVRAAPAIRLVAWGESIRERRESFCLRHDARVGLNYSKMRLLLAFPLLLFRPD
jgi:hypothetical protein